MSNPDTEHNHERDLVLREYVRDRLGPMAAGRVEKNIRECNECALRNAAVQNQADSGGHGRSLLSRLAFWR